MSQEIEAAIAREQERLAWLLEMTRAGKVKIADVPTGIETIPGLLAQIRDAIDQIETAVGIETVQRP